MQRNRKFLLGAVALVLAATGFLVQSADAQPLKNKTKVIHDQVQFTIGPAQCPSLVDTISGTGNRTEVVTTRENADGSTRVIDNAFVNGVASDGGGGSYDFIYSNNNTISIPAGSGPIKYDMTDTFIMKGTKPANTLSVGFVWSWTHTPPAADWPPSDNWVQTQTIGSPLQCDPL